jgi:serine/threonine-protein kinase
MVEPKRGVPGIAVAETLVSAERVASDATQLANANTQLANPSIPAPVRLAHAELEDDGFASRYETSDVLGQGGMGEVRACQDRRIGREVALKVVHRKFGSRGDMKERFLREARVQGQLEHPAVVPVYDLARGPDGEPYFTMKRVRGVTLEKIIELLRAGDEQAKKKYSLRKLLGVLTSVCLALEFVHGRGVVHRDLKPANVMLGDFGEVYLLDWGLAKILGTQDPTVEARPESAPPAAPVTSGARLASGPSALTSAGTLLGTPGYMPREQLLVDLLEIDGRVDVYALGAILFELLTLEKLHSGATLDEVLKSTMDGVVAQPSLRAPQRDVPPELEAICVRATATDASNRYASAREMSEAIERYLDGDRNLEQRRLMATEHALAAERAAKVALSDDPQAAEASRRTAMRELSRALALDPENPKTMRAMVTLLMQPMRELPREVREEMEQLSRDQVRLGGKTGGFVYLSLFLYIPLQLLMGVRSPWLWATYAMALVTSLVSFGVARLARPRTKHSMIVFALSLTSVSSMAGYFGPFVMVPAIAATSALVFATTNDRSHRALIIALGSLAVLVPYCLELAGVVPPSMRFTPDGLVLLPRLLWLPGAWSQVFLLVTSLAVVVTSGLALAPFRDELEDAQRRIRLLAWHLRQLVPKDAIGEARGERGERGKGDGE